MRGRARSRAADLFERNLEAFARIGCRVVGRPGGLQARLEAADGPPLVVRMRGHGRIFGGAYALEVATAEPVFPVSRGLEARGRGVVRLKSVSFRPRRGDEAGASLARNLNEDAALQSALAQVHFERVTVEPEGRPAIRHMGGSVVWVLFPPLVRPVPLIDEQARATIAALGAFAAATAR